MKFRSHKISPTVDGLEDRKLLSATPNNGFGQANAALAQGGYAALGYANYGELHKDFAQGGGEGLSDNGLREYNATGGNSKLENGTTPPGRD